MKGIFIENAFYKSKTVDEMFDCFSSSAKKYGIELTKTDNACAAQRIDLSQRAFDVDFCLYWNKDIVLAKGMEKSGIRLFNCSDAIEVCDNKAMTHLALSDIVKMPKTFHIPFTYENTGYTDDNFIVKYGDILGYPYVIKECFGSLGTGVYLINNLEQARHIIKKCNGIKLLAQEFVRTDKCEYTDIRAYYVGSRCVSSMERYSNEDFRVNVGIGGRTRPYKITPEENDICLKVMKALNLDFAGIDILHSKRGPLVCEVNSNAQFIALNKCCGVDIADEIIQYVIERKKNE